MKKAGETEGREIASGKALSSGCAPDRLLCVARDLEVSGLRRPFLFTLGCGTNSPAGSCPAPAQACDHRLGFAVLPCGLQSFDNA